MQINPVLATLALVAGLASAQTAPPADDWRFAHPKATLVGGVRASALLNSPILKMALAQTGAKDPQIGLGLAIVQNLFRGLTDIRFSLVDNGTPSPDALVLVSGTMDPLTMAMLQGQDAAKMEFVNINPTTLLLGTGASLKAAAARINDAGPAPFDSAAFLQASQITAGHDFWIAGNLPDLPGLPLPKDLNLNLKGFAIGLTLSDNVGLEVAAQTATTEQAEALLKFVRDAETKQPAGTTRPEMSVQGTTARLRITVPADEVIRAMDEVAPMIRAGVPTASLPTLPAEPPKPVKPSRGTVIIQGLEGGPLELPIQ